MNESVWWKVTPPDDMSLLHDSFMVLVVANRVAAFTKSYFTLVGDPWAERQRELERRGFVCEVET